MALTLDYDMTEDGLVKIGATSLNNVTRARVTFDLERNTSTRVAFGGKKRIRGIGTVNATLELTYFDESGITGALNSFLVNAASGTDQTISIFPQGEGAGLKQLILDPPASGYGMDLMSSTPLDAEAGEDLPPVTGSQTWEGNFETQPAETLQS